MPARSHTLTICVKRGSAKGWRGFVWMGKIILPVSLATFLLDYSGWIDQLEGLLGPLMGTLHLPAAAALPLLAGMLTGIYGGIAAMSVLPFSIEQLTLMAVFLLVAHSLVQEGLVQKRSGCPLWMATVLRLTAAAVTVWVLGWFIMEPATARAAAIEPATAVRLPFWPAMRSWAWAMARLSLKMLLIIMVVMVLMDILKQYRLIDRAVRGVAPLLGLLGLDREVGALWLTAAAIGITYGGAVIVEESRERPLRPDQLKTLHISIGINHAMVEDPAVFLPLGIHPLWLWIPRLIAAMAFTHAYRLWLRIRARCGSSIDRVAAADRS